MRGLGGGWWRARTSRGSSRLEQWNGRRVFSTFLPTGDRRCDTAPEASPAASERSPLHHEQLRLGLQYLTAVLGADVPRAGMEALWIVAAAAAELPACKARSATAPVFRATIKSVVKPKNKRGRRTQNAAQGAYSAGSRRHRCSASRSQTRIGAQIAAPAWRCPMVAPADALPAPPPKLHRLNVTCITPPLTWACPKHWYFHILCKGFFRPTRVVAPLSYSPPPHHRPVCATSTDYFSPLLLRTPLSSHLPCAIPSPHLTFSHLPSAPLSLPISPHHLNLLFVFSPSTHNPALDSLHRNDCRPQRAPTSSI